MCFMNSMITEKEWAEILPGQKIWREMSLKIFHFSPLHTFRGWLCWIFVLLQTLVCKIKCFYRPKTSNKLPLSPETFAGLLTKNWHSNAELRKCWAMSGIMETFYEKCAILYPCNALCCCIILVSNKSNTKWKLFPLELN